MCTEFYKKHFPKLKAIWIFGGAYVFFFITSAVNKQYCAFTLPNVNLGSNVFYKQRGTLQPDSHDTLILTGVLCITGNNIKNPLAAIKGTLTIIIMIKGIHLITCFFNYSSVEGRLFGRMLIIPLHSSFLETQDFFPGLSLFYCFYPLF